MLPEKVRANEQLRARQVELGFPATEALPFLCECDDPRCRDVIRLRAAEYAAVRQAPDRCVCVVGHVSDGRIVEAGEGYVVAEKD